MMKIHYVTVSLLSVNLPVGFSRASAVGVDFSERNLPH